MIDTDTFLLVTWLFFLGAGACFYYGTLIFIEQAIEDGNWYDKTLFEKIEYIRDFWEYLTVYALSIIWLPVVVTDMVMKEAPKR